MGRLFYTLQEAAKKLGKSEEEVLQLVKEGKISEFNKEIPSLGAYKILKRYEVDMLAKSQRASQN